MKIRKRCLKEWSTTKR